MSSQMLFEHWRAVTIPHQGSGLAWFLATEFCKRFYRSHGIVPWVIEHEGLGYYGIQLSQLACRTRSRPGKPQGRLTAGGNVENWRTGGPGDHGLETIAMCLSDVATAEIIQQAIEHMSIEPIPSRSHLGCRHQRWGASYVLVFEIAAILMMRNHCEQLQIWNAPAQTDDLLKKTDPKWPMDEHPGAFLFEYAENKLLLAGDGRLLDGSNRDLWARYMKGESPATLADMVWSQLDSY